MKKSILLVIAALALFSPAKIIAAASAPAAALTGRISSTEEARMEGVLVSAKRDGSTVTTTVVSGADGRYSFPGARLEPGRYAIAVRAAGYELDGAKTAVVAAGKTAGLDLKLKKTADLAAQLSNGEWLMSMPGTDEQKQGFLSCVSCHTVERIARSHYNAEELVAVMKRMRTYAQGSTPLRPQVRPGTRDPSPAQLAQMKKFADYVSTVNLGKSDKWNYALKTLPRPKGKATRVIVTEYDLPRPEAMPHDAMLDAQGMIWYSDFGSQFVGMLDPKT
ncbi:MAG TPA: carboxypeptidase regulatory-like domain-containing protein, partial [Candidatus Binatia bacterium]